MAGPSASPQKQTRVLRDSRLPLTSPHAPAQCTCTHTKYISVKESVNPVAKNVLTLEWHCHQLAPTCIKLSRPGYRGKLCPLCTITGPLRCNRQHLGYLGWMASDCGHDAAGRVSVVELTPAASGRAASAHPCRTGDHSRERESGYLSFPVSWGHGLRGKVQTSGHEVFPLLSSKVLG